MPSVSDLLGDSLLATADEGNMERLAHAPLTGPFASPAPVIDPGSAPEDQAIWSWSHDPADVAAVSEVSAATRSRNFLDMRVLDRVRFGPVEIQDPERPAIFLPNLRPLMNLETICS